MPDTYPQITLDPTLTAQPKPMEPVVSPSQSVPLQPVPSVAATQTPQPLSKSEATQPLKPAVPPSVSALPSAMPSDQSSHAVMHDRRRSVQTELEQLQQEESSLLNNIKDWLTKVQGAETKQQALERELFDLDRQLAGVPSPAQAAAERDAKLTQLTQQLQQAESKTKEITKLQKIDEKKAFDNYSAGGLDRQGLLEMMETIRQRYVEQLAAVQSMADEAKQAINELNQPTPVAAPTPEAPRNASTGMTPIATVLKAQSPVESVPVAPVAESVPVEPIATATPVVSVNPVSASPLINKLATLPEAAEGLLHHLVIELPAQGSYPLIQRSSDGTGVIISADANATITDRCFLADADILRVGATAEDIIPLPISQIASNEATPLPAQS